MNDFVIEEVKPYNMRDLLWLSEREYKNPNIKEATELLVLTYNYNFYNLRIAFLSPENENAYFLSTHPVRTNFKVQTTINLFPETIYDLLNMKTGEYELKERVLKITDTWAPNLTKFRINDDCIDIFTKSIIKKDEPTIYLFRINKINKVKFYETLRKVLVI